MGSRHSRMGKEYTGPVWVEALNDLVDEKGKPQWKIQDGVPVHVAQPYTDAELEERRKTWVLEQIRRRYLLSTEQRITRENIAKLAAGEAVTAEFSAYNTYIEAVKTESQRRKTNQDWSDYTPEETSE